MLGKRYRNIADAVFNGDSDDVICRRMRIRKEKLIECFDQVAFCEYMELLHKKEVIQTRSRLVRHGNAASDRLVQLLNHDKDDVARKAAVDILGKCIDNVKMVKAEIEDKTQIDCDISDQKAREMLAILAEGMKPADSCVGRLR